MKVRFAASVVLAAGVVIGTAGCGFITPQGTARITQSTSFGVEGTVGDVHIRNAYLVAQGQQVALVATFVNKGESGQTVSIQPKASADDTKSLRVGDVDEGPTIIGPQQTLQWDDLKVAKGSLVPVFFTYGDKTGVTLNLPVLTGDFKVNSTLTPTPVPTETATPSATDTATPGATDTATPTPTPTP
ncbi:hypothetical protein GCM10022286_14600 [Gryllotalpicola daejeonensis]|uniref:DNA modification methylase n=1 Tax=Gryllotalpicola daejeonensis TaxID=993087 RepID=A0ABP7ZJ73_9MICO